MWGWKIHQWSRQMNFKFINVLPVYVLSRKFINQWLSPSSSPFSRGIVAKEIQSVCMLKFGGGTVYPLPQAKFKTVFPGFPLNFWMILGTCLFDFYLFSLPFIIGLNVKIWTFENVSFSSCYIFSIANLVMNDLEVSFLLMFKFWF